MSLIILLIHISCTRCDVLLGHRLHIVKKLVKIRSVRNLWLQRIPHSLYRIVFYMYYPLADVSLFICEIWDYVIGARGS